MPMKAYGVSNGYDSDDECDFCREIDIETLINIVEMEFMPSSLIMQLLMCLGHEVR